MLTKKAYPSIYLSAARLLYGTIVVPFLYCTVFPQLSKKHGSVFTVHFGPKKVVVLAGYKTVKEALVNYAEEFGNRDIMPIFHDFNKGHGKVINV